MTQLMEEIGPVRIRIDFDYYETRDDVVDLLEEIAPYSGSITPQQSEEKSDQEDSEEDEEEDEEEETDLESVQSKESIRLSSTVAQKVNPAPSDWMAQLIYIGDRIDSC